MRVKPLAFTARLDSILNKHNHNTTKAENVYKEACELCPEPRLLGCRAEAAHSSPQPALLANPVSNLRDRQALRAGAGGAFGDRANGAVRAI